MSSREPGFAALIMLAACGSVTALPDAAATDAAPPDAAPRDAAPPDALACSTTPVEVLPNGNFDSATPPWGQAPASPALLCGQPTITPASAPSSACLGSIDGTIQSLTQTVTLPRGATSL